MSGGISLLGHCGRRKCMIGLIKMAFFIGVVVLLGVGTIALKRRNEKIMSDCMNEIMNTPESEEKNINMKSEEVKTEPISYISPKKQDLNKVVIPKDTEFSEVMDLLVYLAKKYPEEVGLKLNVPVSALSISLFEQRTGIKFTEELNALYQFADGFELNCGNFELMELEQIETHYRNDIYEWGNTKNYIFLGTIIGDGEAVFLDGQTGHIISYDHGRETDHETITSILDYIIEIFVEVDDERLEN